MKTLNEKVFLHGDENCIYETMKTISNEKFKWKPMEKMRKKTFCGLIKAKTSMSKTFFSNVKSSTKN